jgi:iron complex outermembrane receptor protein
MRPFSRLLASSGGLIAGTLLAVQVAYAQTTFQFDLPAQPLADSLRAVGRVTHLNVLFDPPAVDGLQAPALKSTLTADQAFSRLLSGTSLKHKFLDERTVTLVTTARTKTSESRPSPVPTSDPVGSATSSGSSADAQPSPTGIPGSTGDNRVPPSGALEEIVVTAQKREERLLDVPMSLTVLSGDQLARSQSYTFEDYVGKVPGLTLIDNGATGSQLVIRGITNGSTPINSSVATYVDETPFTAAGPWANSQGIAPNLDTFDMQRIEVLKGPQGTLYGANALGGLLKFVTNAPDPTAFAAKAEVGVTSVYNGGQGYDSHAMINLPLSSDAALRIVGYDNYYPGFIDDPSRGVTDINGTHFTGGRASLLFEATPDFSIRLNALYQEKTWGDWPNEDVNAGTLTPLYGNLTQEHLISQPGDIKTELYNLTVNWSFEAAKILSATSYYDSKTHYLQDLSDLYGPAFFGGPYGLAVPATFPVHALTEEVRVSSLDDGPLQWQVGGYFTNEGSNETTLYLPIDTTTRTILYSDPLGLGGFDAPTHYQEFAGFASLDYHFTPTFDASVGGRYSENHQTFHETAPGLFGGGFDFGVDSSESVGTYSGDVRWHLTPQQMLYARIATGFVPGGPNDSIPNAVVARSYSSSTTINYELGVKSQLLDHRLTLEASVFHIDWRKIQLTAFVNGFGQIVNGGAAKSDGFEWALAYAPLAALTLGFNGAYTDARLTEPIPSSVSDQPLGRLPSSPLWESSASADYQRPLTSDYSGFLGVDWRFLGSRYADFQPTGPRQEMPKNNIVDLRTGIDASRWTLTFYVKNVGNKIAINYVQPETLNGGAGAQSATVYTPRTFGASISARY